MPAFRDLSITNKLRCIVLIISGLTLFLACGILGFIEVMNFKQSQVNELRILSNIIADRCTASLTFDDPKISLETLNTLHAKPSILSAHIFNQNGKLFAAYKKVSLASDIHPDITHTDPYRFEKDSLLIYEPILLDNQKIGSVYIRSDLSQMHQMIQRYLSYVLLVMLGSLLVVFFLLSKFQRFISRPILNLAHTAEKIAMDMNFSSQVPKEGKDEIGLLVDAFNTMLDQIKQRDFALMESKNRAEASAQKARELARETYRINLTLQNEITERKRVFQSMLESEKKYRGIFENAQEGIFRATPENRFLDVNPSMARILGYPSPEALVQSIADIRQIFIQSSDQERLYDLLNTQESVSRFECRLKRKDNTLIWVSVQAVAYKDKESNLMFVEGLVEDITDRKLAEEALKDSYRQLEKRVEERTAELRRMNEELLAAKQAADDASNAKSVFLANMSHEIRTPMNGVISAAELALAEDMSPKIRHYLKIIQSSGNALMGVINDILDFSKIDAGKLTIENYPFRIDDVLNNVIAIFAHTAAEKNIEIVVDIDPATPFEVIGDPLRLQQILTNLMSNSVKFTDSGGMICVKVRFEKTLPHSIRLIFSVKDTGVGMPPHQLDALFQAFYQGDASTTRKFGGTGLGLSISKQLVELMNGEIKAKSEFGKGSEFIFTVPLELQPDHIQDVVELPDHLKGLCILIVDDCRETRNVLSNIVESFGFHAETAPSGMAAIEMIQSEKHKPFDLILIDFKMPQMHGLETAVTIRSELKMDIPIVLMIDYVDKSVLPESAQMFVNRFLTKPVMGSSLFNLLLEIFGEKTVVEEKPQPYMTESLNGYRKALGGLKVLVAEDNPINQELAIEIFKTIGVEVVIAEDGVKALEALAAQPFDAVLMDIQMPHMDGYETTHKIRENEAFKNLPIIAMTASALPSDEKKCLDAGMNAYVAKPIQLKKLFQVLYENVLSKNSDDFVMLLDSPDIPRIPRRSAEPAPGISSDSIQRLNMDEAMRNLNIDADVYTRIMKTFLLKNQNVMPQIKIWAGLQKWEEIRSHAHSIAGSSSNIGAFHLESAARELETFCREAEINGHADLSRLDWVVGNFDKELNLALAAIDEFLKFSEVKDMPHEISGEELQEKTACLNNLLHALKASDPSKIKASLDHLKKNVDLSTANQIEAKIMDYDYDEAGRMLLKIGLDMGIHLTWDSEK